MLAARNVRRRPGKGKDQSRDRAVRPVVEGLEDRKLLYATSGGQWAFGSRITYSFVPDGTSIGGTPSVLAQSLNARGFSNAVWQQQVEKAAAVWEAVANINLAQVSDSGDAIGVNGNQQDDSRFGDIRIGGYSQGTLGPLAFAFLPPPYNGGTDAGDIFFNTDIAYQVNGTAYDLETVAIHEFGHALGMAHSAISTADMYAYYNATKQSLTSDDIQGIQSIYGVRQPDAVSNGSFATATDLTPDLNGQGQIALSGLEIASFNDTDYYSVTVPANTTGTMTVTMQATNLSSESPRVLLYNQAHTTILANVAAPYSYGGTVTATIGNVSPGQVYYIRCQGATPNDPSGIGNYGLEVNFGSGTMAPIAPPDTVVLQQPDQGGGSSNDQGYGPGRHHRHDPGTITVGSLTAFGDVLTIGDPDSEGGQDTHPGQDRGPGHRHKGDRSSNAQG